MPPCRICLVRDLRTPVLAATCLWRENRRWSSCLPTNNGREAAANVQSSTAQRPSRLSNTGFLTPGLSREIPRRRKLKKQPMTDPAQLLQVIPSRSAREGSVCLWARTIFHRPTKRLRSRRPRIGVTLSNPMTGTRLRTNRRFSVSIPNNRHSTRSRLPFPPWNTKNNQTK